MSTKPPIIIIKKKGGHGGHHGGAWKVAYADFVTAMMALFIVLWLMNASPETKKAVSVYFNDPTGRGKETGSGMAGTGESVAVKKDDMNQLKEKLEAAMKQLPEFPKLKDHMTLTVTGEGLRIELLESESGVFFESGSARPSAAGEEIIQLFAKELGKLPNSLLIEGHTDSRPFNREGYGNWELSADRANAARRVMQNNGVRSNQVVQVRGFADQQLRKVDDPESASNRRISVIVRYQTAVPGSKGDQKAEASGPTTGKPADHAPHAPPAEAGKHVE